MFNKQVARARATSINRKWKNERPMGYSPSRGSGFSNVRSTIADKSFSSFANKAYSSPDGYAIRRNPKTGQKEMFVRGTTFKRGGVEWLQNIAEAPGVGSLGLGEQFAGDVSRHIRGKYSKFLTNVAKREHVSVIYGHSRGGAVVNDMKVPGASKVGLDAATILNRAPTIPNYRQKQAFDAVIGANARVTYKTKRWVPLGSKRYHRVYGK